VRAPKDRGDPSSAEDAALISASIDRPELFAELFDRYFLAVFRYLARRAGSEDAADLSGETFCVAFERRHRYDLERGDALPWLYGIAHNVLRAHRRRGERCNRAYERWASEAQHVVAEDPASAAAMSVDSARELVIVNRALGDAPPESVEALRLLVWEELSYEEIAVVLAIPLGTVRSRISRLRDRLRRELAHGNDTVSVGESDRGRRA
jgi:RNA polymerase sigma factor (sigma-70 family)